MFLKNRVVFYSKYDMSRAFHFERIETLINSFDINNQYTDINDIMELYHVKCFFDNEIYHRDWNDDKIKKYKATVNRFNGVLGRFFAKINGENCASIYKELNFDYRKSFWTLIEYFNVYLRIDGNQFCELLKDCSTALRNILFHKKIVLNFDAEIANVLTENINYAELVFDYYIVKHRNDAEKMYMPNSFSPENQKKVLKNYIKWKNANPNYLQIIATVKASKDFATDDRIRFSAQKRFEEYWNSKSGKVQHYQTFGVEVIFYDDSNGQKEPTKDSEKNIDLYTYGTSWIKENLDYPTILNNFIYLFGYTDLHFRCQFLSNPSKLGVFERDIMMSGEKSYRTGVDYNYRHMLSNIQMTAYVAQLLKNNIRIENVFKWFFETYLLEEFNVKDFSYIESSENASTYEKILVLVSQFDAVIKQYRIFLEDGYINREYFEFASSPYRMSDTPSLVKDKYVYPQSDTIKSAIYHMFSDQSLLYYVGESERYNSFPDLIKNKNMTIADFENFNQPIIKWLYDNNFININDLGIISIDKNVEFVLKNLFNNGVISQFHCSNGVKELIKNWIDNGNLVAESSLFSKQEQDFIDYMLNVQQFHNGPELRNKYVHGTFSLREETQEEDYMELLKIMVLLIIKINEDFCIAFPIVSKEKES